MNRIYQKAVYLPNQSLNAFIRVREDGRAAICLPGVTEDIIVVRGYPVNLKVYAGDSSGIAILEAVRSVDSENAVNKAALAMFCAEIGGNDWPVTLPDHCKEVWRVRARAAMGAFNG